MFSFSAKRARKIKARIELSRLFLIVRFAVESSKLCVFLLHMFVSKIHKKISVLQDLEYFESSPQRIWRLFFLLFFKTNLHLTINIHSTKRNKKITGYGAITSIKLTFKIITFLITHCITNPRLRTSWRTCSKKQTSFQTIISKYSKYFLTETQSIMVLCFKTCFK